MVRIQSKAYYTASLLHDQQPSYLSNINSEKVTAEGQEPTSQTIV